MEGNDKLEQLLTDIISNTDKAHLMAVEMGIEAEPAPGESEPDASPDGTGSETDESTTDEESPEVTE